MKVLTRAISIIFHPLLMVTWVFVLFSRINKFAFIGVDDTKLLGIKLFINTFFFPALAIFLMWRLEFIPDLKMKDKKDRIAPFFPIIIGYVWTFMIVKKSDALIPGVLHLFVLGAIISVVLSFIMNVFMRLNLHMVGMGAFLMLLFLVTLRGNGEAYANIFVIAVIITGFLASARVKEESSTMVELYYGLLIGFIGQMVGFIALSWGGYSII